MSQRTLRRLGIILVVAAATYAVLFLLDRRPTAGPADAGALLERLQTIPVDRVASIEIVGPADTVRLERTPDGWTADGYDADSARVNRIWATLAEADVDGVAGTNPANHERFGVAGADAWHLTFVEEDGARHDVILGNAGTRFASSYARLPDEDAVIHLVGDLRSTVARTLDQWRNRTVAALDTGAVASLILTRDGRRSELARGDSAWTGPSGPVDADAVRGVLQEIAALSATGFAADTVTVPAGAGARSLVVRSVEGDTLLALLGAPGDNTFRLRRLDQPTVFEVATWRGDRIFLHPDSVAPGG